MHEYITTYMMTYMDDDMREFDQNSCKPNKILIYAMIMWHQLSLYKFKTHVENDSESTLRQVVWFSLSYHDSELGTQNEELKKA